MDLCAFYQLWPGKDCGICGCGSCNTFARCVVFKHEDFRKCVWLTEANADHILKALGKVNPVTTQVRKSAVFQPCITDSEMVMAEFYLAPREVEYGYLDPGFCEILPLYFESVKSSRNLGIARIEHEGKEILISQTGKVVVRQAQNEEDAVKICNMLSRLVSGSVICSCLATGLECISGLCSCTECEILHKVQSPLLREEMWACIGQYETAVKKGLSRMWKGEFTTELQDAASLKAKAVTLLSETAEGLIYYSLIHHLSSMVKALEEAASSATKSDEHSIDHFVMQALNSSFSTEEYHETITSLREYIEHPFFRELYKVVFHAKCTAEIKKLVESCKE